ncbi:MAG: hypothetical protein H0T57_12595 [Rubrobacter sp.]|nr:hypothetical protein [Rubrobacter sp.]
MIVNFEVDPGKQVGRVEVKEIKKDEVLLSVDEAGNVFGIEVMGRASETFDLARVAVLGLKAEEIPPSPVVKGELRP